MQTTRKPILVANWKSHGSLKENRIWAQYFLTRALPVDIDLVVCPPFPYIPQLLELCNDSTLTVGAQNLSAHREGAYTGEVSAQMLMDLGCLYVIIGHSERRSLYEEDDKQLIRKLQRAIACGLTPIFCIGETLQQRKSLQTHTTLIQQLSTVAPILKGSSFVLAYEPIWAIGTGQTATPEQVQQVHSFLREHLVKQLGEEAKKLRIIYGGSIQSDNAKALFEMSDIAGGLVGGASLQAKDFFNICRSLVEVN